MESREFHREKPPHPDTSSPLLQRVSWIATSVAAMAAIGGGLLGLFNVLDSVVWEIALVAFSFGLVIAIIQTRPKDRKSVDWEDAFHRLQSFRKYHEEQMIYKKYVSEGYFQSETGEKAVQEHLDSLLEYKVYLKALYRAAILSGQSKLANDFQAELEEVQEWKTELIETLDSMYLGND